MTARVGAVICAMLIVGGVLALLNASYWIVLVAVIVTAGIAVPYTQDGEE